MFSLPVFPCTLSFFGFIDRSRKTTDYQILNRLSSISKWQSIEYRLLLLLSIFNKLMASVLYILFSLNNFNDSNFSVVMVHWTNEITIKRHSEVVLWSSTSHSSLLPFFEKENRKELAFTEWSKKTNTCTPQSSLDT